VFGFKKEDRLEEILAKRRKGKVFLFFPELLPYYDVKEPTQEIKGPRVQGLLLQT